MSYPRIVSKFIPWSKAMVQGAKVDRPEYPGTSKTSTKKSKTRHRKRRRKSKRRKRAKKIT